jgi:hypothetical protein
VWALGLLALNTTLSASRPLMSLHKLVALHLKQSIRASFTTIAPRRHTRSLRSPSLLMGGLPARPATSLVWDRNQSLASDDRCLPCAAAMCEGPYGSLRLT